jgi:hypothetical protein
MLATSVFDWVYEIEPGASLSSLPDAAGGTTAPTQQISSSGLSNAAP